MEVVDVDGDGGEVEGVEAERMIQHLPLCLLQLCMLQPSMMLKHLPLRLLQLCPIHLPL